MLKCLGIFTFSWQTTEFILERNGPRHTRVHTQHLPFSDSLLCYLLRHLFMSEESKRSSIEATVGWIEENATRIYALRSHTPQHLESMFSVAFDLGLSSKGQA